MKTMIQILALVSMGTILLSCTIKTVRDGESVDEPAQGPGVEYSLKEDRSKLKELRQEIPAPVQQQNDDLAGILKMFTDGNNRYPNEIRSKFERRVRKTRDRFKKDLKKDRKNFTKKERRKRDQFLSKAKKDRKKFTAVRRGNEERKAFFDQQKQDRSEFFAQERDDRKEFESETRQKSNDFNSYIRETRREFYDLHRSYSKRYYQQKTMEKKKKKMERAARVKAIQTNFNSTSGVTSSGSQQKSPQRANPSNVIEEFNELDQVQGQPLSPDGN